MKKIIINLPQYRDSRNSQGGYLNYLYKMLSPYYDVSIICSKENKDAQYRILFKYNDSSNFRLMKIIFYLFLNIKVFFHLFLNRETYIVNVSQENIFPFFLKRQVCFIHDLIQISYPRNKMAYIYYKFILPSLARKTLLNFSPSISTINELRKIRVNSLLNYRWYFKEEFPLQKEKKFQESKYYAVFVGTLAEHKNFKLFHSIAQKLPDKLFVAILPKNQTWQVNNLPNLIIQTSLEDLKYKSLLMSTKYIVSPSLEEGFGPIFDALSLNVFPVLSSIPVYQELYRNIALFPESETVDDYIMIMKNNEKKSTNKHFVKILSEKVYSSPLQFLSVIRDEIQT
jgi:glycosyltransferase involved in cell wall biosynthesis